MLGKGQAEGANGLGREVAGSRLFALAGGSPQPSRLPRSEVPLQHTALGEKVHGVPASGAALGAVRPWRLGQGGFSGMPRHPKPTSRHGNVVLVHLTLVRLPNCQRCSPLSDRPPGSPQLYLRTLPLFGPLHPNRLDEPWRNRGSRRSSSSGALGPSTLTKVTTDILGAWGRRTDGGKKSNERHTQRERESTSQPS